MLSVRTWEYICRTAGQIPDPLRSCVRSEIAISLGLPVSEMFPRFASRMPMTVNRMEAHWSRPILLFRQFRTKWVAALALEGPQLNLFFDLCPIALKTDGSDFETSHSMLPEGWKELYRSFWSFGITSDDLLGLHWKNTPFSYSSRLTVGNYSAGRTADSQGPLILEQELGSNQLVCWLATDAGDTLWLDESRCDKKVYHVSDDRFDEAKVLSDPNTSLDHYLAHTVSGYPSSGFNFRSPTG